LLSLLFFNILFTMLFLCIYYILSYTICLPSSIINLFLTFLLSCKQFGAFWKGKLIFTTKQQSAGTRRFIRYLYSFLASILPLLLNHSILLCFCSFSCSYASLLSFSLHFLLSFILILLSYDLINWILTLQYYTFLTFILHFR